MQGYLVFQMYRAVVVVTNNTEICLNGSKLITGVITHYPANGDSSREAQHSVAGRPVPGRVELSLTGGAAFLHVVKTKPYQYSS